MTIGDCTAVRQPDPGCESADAGGPSCLPEGSQDRLRYRLTVEEAIAAASRVLIRSAGTELDQVLRLLGEAVDADRAYVFRFREDGRILDNMHEWRRPGLQSQIQALHGIDSHVFPWGMDQLRSGANLVIPQVEALPPAAAAERELLEAHSIRSLLMVPISFADGTMAGLMGFDDVRGKRAWEVEEGRALRLVGEMIAAQWERTQAEERLRSREAALHRLVRELNRVRAPVDAARAVLETADQLLGWDAAWLVLCSPDRSRVEPLVMFDRIEGQRVEVPSCPRPLAEGGMVWRSLHEGPFRIERTRGARLPEETQPPCFGDRSRRSASILCVPIWDGPLQVGSLSIQSYSPGAYGDGDLETLQRLAEHCAGALKRCQAECEHARLIEDRLQAETARYESEDALRFALTAARLGIWDRDLRTELTTWTDYGQADAQGEPCRYTLPTADFWASIHPEDRERLMRASEEAISNNMELAMEFRMTVPELGERWVCSRGRVLRGPGGEPLRIIGTGEDVTERKRLELALWEQQALHDAVLENLTEGVLAFDLNGTLTYCNQSVREQYGVGETPLSFAEWTDRFRVFHADGATPMRPEEMPLTYAVQGKSLRDVEVAVKLPTGEMRRLLVSAHPMRNAAGEQHGVVATLRDVTAGRQLEEQFRQVQKMEAVGRLAGGVAHDFNNVLAVVNGYAGLILSSAELDLETRYQLEEIQKAGERAANLTRQLLAFSRREVIAPKRFDLGAAVTNMQGMLRRLIGEDIELVTTTSGSSLPVMADPGQVEQILLNLAVNARDAMPKGGWLTVECGMVVLDQEYADVHSGVTPGRYALLAVSDTGHGMDRATQERIFEPFFTTKPLGAGTGLGLSTVYGIVRQWEGHVRVYSERDLGTTFKIYLPLADRPAEEESRPVREITPGSETILLVEDEESVRRLARRILERAGYTVLEAPSAVEGLRIAEARDTELHLLVTDIVMPQMSGRELTERLAARRPELRVLYMSGYTDDAVVRHGVLVAEAEFIQKPFTAAELTRRVRELLDRPRRTGAGGVEPGVPETPSHRAAVASGAPVRDAGTGGPGATGGRLLLVDDCPAEAESLAEILTEHGYAVTTAGNGKKALALLREGTEADLILLDLVMPVMNGWVFRTEQMKDPALAGIPVITLSGVFEPEPAAEFLSASGSFAKPIDIPALLAAIEAVLAPAGSGKG